MQWAIDPSHSSLEIAVRHMGLSTVRGRFKTFRGTLEATEDNILRSVEVSVDAASIDTGEPQRDDHLRSGDFLDAQRHPKITFRSTAVEARGDGRYLVAGDLVIRDQARPVTLEVETAVPVTDPWGNLRAAAGGKGTLNRKDWGLTYNRALEFGGWMVGEEVRFAFDVEVVAAVPAHAR